MNKSTLEKIEGVLKRALMIVTPDASDTEQYVKQLRKAMEEESDAVEAVHSRLVTRYTVDQVDSIMFAISLLLTGVPDDTVRLFMDVMEKDSVEYFNSLTDEQRSDVTAVMILAKIMDQENDKPEKKLPCTCAKCMAKAPKA
jgi:hypothetical protein